MRIVINGLEQQIAYDHHAIDEILVPRLERWIATTSGTGRQFAFLAAPPGTGKSTLAELLERALSGRVQCVGMDGFHLPQAELERRTFRRPDGTVAALRSIKGAPETFDLAALDDALTRAQSDDIRWPRYDRTLHDVAADGPTLTADHVLVEGNWLLLDEPGWSDLRRHASFTILLTAPEELLRPRLVARKVQGGLSSAEAEAFYDASDGPNVRRALEHSSTQVDVRLSMDVNGAFHERTIS